MATKHQTPEKETKTATMGFGISDLMPKTLVTPETSELGRQRKAKGIDLTMVSLVAAMIAIQLTLMIALITPKGPVAQQLVESAIMEQPVSEAPTAATLELPASPTIDKRFMNGLEVAPAPADADPFANNGTKRK
jgi:hypothetical protein